MGRLSKKSPSSGTIEDAPDAQLLRVFSKPATWADAGMKPVRPRTTSTRRRRAQSILSASILFDLLPAEILDMILLQLDYRSLARICLTNSKAKSYIQNQRWFRLVVEFGHHALQALSILNLLHVHSAKRIYDVLVDAKCAHPGCERMGNSLFLPSCQRSCIACLGTTPFSTVIMVEKVQSWYGLTEAHIMDHLQVLRLPGYQEWFVRDADARELSARLLGKGKEKEKFRRWSSELWTEKLTVPFPFFDPESKKVEWVRQCRACAERYVEHRGMWDHIDREPEHDFWRLWTQHVGELEGPGQALYGPRQLLAHIRGGSCREAEQLWKARKKSRR